MLDIDVIFSELVEQMFGDRLNEALDTTQWTVENRDQKVDEIISICQEISDELPQFMESVLQPNMQGKSFLYWRMLRQFYSSLAEHMTNMRNEYDMLSPDQRTQVCVDYEWMNATIPKVRSLVAGVDRILESGTPTIGQVQEL